MSDIKSLQALTKGISILYVEDNVALRENASKLFQKFFDSVESAEDGLAGLELFKKHHHPLVVTDIKMPKMDGIALALEIKKIKPETKVIIMSAYDDKELLLKSIELGVFRFIKKPVVMKELSDVLLSAVQEIHEERDARLFHLLLQSIFNYQSSMVLMLDDATPLLANQILLDFFDVKDIKSFKEKVGDIGQKFLKHDGFLFGAGKVPWMDIVKHSEHKLFHTKMQNTHGEMRHFILKYQAIPETKSRGVLSFEDVTELNLMKLFDKKETINSESESDKQAMYDLLDVIKRNAAKIEMHNFYKGLSITNDAVIIRVTRNSIIIKTTYLQQKAMQYEQKTYIVSEALPKTLICQGIASIVYENQSVELEGISFVDTSPITRKTVRVVPDAKQSASIFLGENKFYGEVTIEDISLDAVKLRLDALPAGLVKGSVVTLDLVLELDKKPLIIHTEATLYRKSESKHSFSLVFLFDNLKKNDLVKYITKRQMAIIREFKGL